MFVVLITDFSCCLWTRINRLIETHVFNTIICKPQMFPCLHTHLGQDSKYEEHNSNIIETDSALCSKGAISPAKLDILECRHPMKRAALTPSPEQEMLIISYTPSHNARHPSRNIPPDKMGEEWKTETQCADGKWAHHFTQIITRA